ncbi:MAG: T9SS type A sorting domain-containing protein, partial [Bacteroidota bacterium]
VNSTGCTATTPTAKAVTVNPLPIPTITGSAAVCAGSTGVIYSTESGMTGYAWTLSSGGTITAGTGTNAITVTWNTAGAQNVYVNYVNSTGCTATTPTAKAVTVNALPVPVVSGPTNNICPGAGYNTYTTQYGYNNYIWTTSSGGTIVSGQGTASIDVYWTTSGAQWITVIYSNSAGCSPAAPTQVNVNVLYLPGPAGAVSGSSSVCAGAQGVAYSVAPISNAIAYVWTLPAGVTIASGAGTNNITVNFATNASSGNMTVYGNDLCGNGTVSPPFPVTVNPLPAGAGTVSGPSTVCQGENGVNYSVVTIANATSYSWTVPSGATIVSGGTTNTITVDFAMNATAGNVTVYGSNSCGNGAVSPALAVILHPKPATPVVTAIGNMLTSSASSGNQWYFSATQGGTGNIIPGATSQSYAATQTGWYFTVVTAGGCESDPSLRVYILMVGVDELLAGNFNIFPVPNDGKFTISMTSTSKENFTITVFNSLGVQIREIRDVQVNGRFDQVVDLRPVDPGIYMIVIRNSEQQIVKKIIVGK